VALQLLGEYDCKIDPKGRMRLPSGLIGQLGERESYTFVINRGFENCLMLYPIEVWEEISKKINQLNTYGRKEREFVRYFYRGASKITMDAADRILLTKGLLDYAGIDKDVVLSAFNDSIEIWSKDQYDNMLDNEPDNFADLAEELLGSSKTNLLGDE
jgi:MraZ protein